MIGEPVIGWTPRPQPPRTPMIGRFCRVEPLDVARHADDLFDANAEDQSGANFTYLSTEPFTDREAYRDWLLQRSRSDDPLFHVVVDHSERAVGLMTFMRIDAPNGVIEVGNINFSPRLQRTPAATEAQYLMMRRAFDELGYRRYEWKCDSLNAPSRAAAERLGFTFEGIFRQALVYKNRNRDTAWYAIIDRDWPPIRDAFERWLDPANFDAEGRQRAKLVTPSRAPARA